MLLILATSCEDVRLHTFHSIDGEWKATDTLDYTFAPGIKNEAYMIDVQLRSEASYPFSELWIGVQCRADSAGVLSTDTLRCEIFDSLGQHRGTTGGTLYQTSHQLGVREIPGGDTVRIRLYHLMESSIVKDITDAGIKITALSPRQF